jgi:hypothetical protein
MLHCSIKYLARRANRDFLYQIWIFEIAQEQADFAYMQSDGLARPEMKCSLVAHGIMSNMHYAAKQYIGL